MRALLAVLVTLPACGRVGFDGMDATTFADANADAGDAAAVCVPVGNDDDSDGVDDACDDCPHLSGAQLDTDGDGVGDRCDPNPTVPTERIAWFEPFVGALAPEWHSNGVGGISGSTFSVSDATGAIDRPYADTSDTFSFVGRYTDTTTGQGFQAQIRGSGATFYYCEVHDFPSTPNVQLTYYNGATYDSLAYHALATTDLDGATFSVTFTHTPTTVGCDVELPQDSVQMSAPVPAGIAPTSIHFVFTGGALTVDSLIDVRTE